MTKVDGASPEEASDELAHGLRQSQAAGQVDRFAYERPGQATSRRKRVLSRTHAFGLSRERFHLPPLTMRTSSRPETFAFCRHGPERGGREPCKCWKTACRSEEKRGSHESFKSGGAQGGSSDFG